MVEQGGVLQEIAGGPGGQGAAEVAIRAGPSRGDGRRPPDDELPETKVYLRQQEMYGGQANVLATEIREGFAGLWHGKPLGVTVAVLGILLRAGLRFVADPLPLEDDEPPAPPPPEGR
jgi:hypothetical protein